MTEQELQAAFRAEFAERQNETITVEMSIGQAWCLLCQVQLASRHPNNNGPTLGIAADAIADICRAMNFGPAMREVANRGWQSEHDRARGEEIKPPSIIQ